MSTSGQPQQGEQPPPETRPLAQQPPEEASVEAQQAAAYAGALTAVHLAILTWLAPDAGGPPMPLDDPVSVRVEVGNQFDAHRETLRERVRVMTDGGAEAGRAAAARRHDLDIDAATFDRETQRALREMATAAATDTHSRQARDIARSIADAHQAGLSAEEIATRLRSEVFPPMRQWEARRLARTQVHQGAERGKLAAFRSTGVGEVMWLSAFLPASRETHVAASGQTRAPGELFDLAGHVCSHPGDPRLPVGHVVNCMCRLTISP